MSGGVRTALTALAAAVAGALIGIFAVIQLQQPPQPPEQRPDFTLPTLAGDQRSIREWDGEIIVLNFWATWCAPCRREIPLLNALQSEYADQGVQFVGLAIDDPEPIRRFIQDVPIEYPNVYGMQNALDVAAAYGNSRGTLPYTVIIDRDGNIAERLSGEVHREDIVPIIEDLAGQRR